MASRDDNVSGPLLDPVPRPAAEPTDEEANLIDVRRHWRTLVRRRLLVLLVTGVTVAVMAIVTLPTRNRYVATTQIRIDPTAPAVLDLKDAATPVIDQSYYQTEYAILDSPALATRVITALRLWDDPRFEAHSEAKAGTDADRARSLVRPYLENLRITPMQGSRLVAIEYASTSPQLAAQISRAHAHEFIRMALESRTDVNGEAQRFLQQKLDELQGRMEASEAALNEFRRAHPNVTVTASPEGTLVVEGLKSLSADPVYAAMREQRESLRADYERLSQIYRPKYPVMVELAGRIDQLNARLEAQARSGGDGAESEHATAGKKENAPATTGAPPRRGDATDTNDTTVQLQVLAREVNTHRRLYQSLLSRAKEIEIADGLHRTNVSIVSLAEVPDVPSTDRFRQNLLRGLLLGLCLGFLAAFGLEALDRTVRTLEDVEGALHLPLLAVVPALDEGGLSGDGPGRGVVTNAAGAQDPANRARACFLEAFRTLRTTVLLGANERSPQVIQIASAQGHEGKTLVTVQTALALAEAGARVLVVDADLHRPRCHQLLGVARGPGLTDALDGVPLAACVQSVPLPETSAPHGRLDLLAAGGSSTTRPSTVAGPGLLKTLEAARGSYDHLLIDSPPLLAVADGLLLASMADGVLLVIRNETTPRPVVKQAMARLARVGARVLGAVLNHVDLDSMRDYYGEQYPPASTTEAA